MPRVPRPTPACALHEAREGRRFPRCIASRGRAGSAASSSAPGLGGDSLCQSRCKEPGRTPAPKAGGVDDASAVEGNHLRRNASKRSS